MVAVWHSLAYLCTLSASSVFIDPSLHQLDSFKKSFYGNLFLFFFDIPLVHKIVVHYYSRPAPMANYPIILWAATWSKCRHCSTFLRDHWKMLNVDCSFASN